MSGAVVRLDDVASLAQRLAPVRAAGGRVAFVPTMGALHEGHLSLVELAERLVGRDGAVVVSVFVNPTQFDDAADLAAYPVDLEADLAAIARVAGTMGREVLVHAPDVTSVYPEHPAPMATTVHVRGLTDHLCGPHRPGHFDAVATVVVKLLGRVRPDVLVLGRKDAQQLVVVRRVVADLELGVEVVGAPTVRDDDGLASSSRNRRLAPEARAVARAVPRALAAGVARAREGRRGAHGASSAGDGPDHGALGSAGPDEVVAAVRAVLDAAGTAGVPLEVEYVELVDPVRLAPLVATPGAAGPSSALLALAVRVGAGTDGVRLIDAVTLGDVEDEDRLRVALGRAGAAIAATGAGTASDDGRGRPRTAEDGRGGRDAARTRRRQLDDGRRAPRR